MTETAETVPGVTDNAPPRPRVLLVDDDDAMRVPLGRMLEHHGFDVATATNVNQAIGCIASRTFDVLVSDLHMPEPGDGLTVVSAMRHANPKAVTLILSAFPEMQRATAAILLQADAIMVKPMAARALAETIRERLKGATARTPRIESVADILEQETKATIADWLVRIDADRNLISVHLSDRDRSSHLPELFHDLVARLRNPLPLGSTRTLVSPAAHAHGLLRRTQGYSAAMLVEESRMLQVSIFQTLQNNLEKVDFSIVLVSVMAIADEVDSQLAQAMTSYISETKVDALPLTA